jgi:succinoglycan biosynthesis transport protein ExoP
MENQTKLSSLDISKNGKVPVLPEYLQISELSPIEEESGQLFDTLRRRLPLIAGITAATTAATWAITWNQPPVYEGGLQLLIEPVNSQAQQAREPLSQNSQDSNSNKGGVDYATQIEVLKSPKLMQPILEQVKTRYPNFSSATLAKDLKIENPSDTKLIQVTYSSSDPDQVKFFLDKLAEAYLRYSQKERESNLSYGISFVDRQIVDTRKRVDSLQRQLQAFRQQNSFIAPDSLAGQVTGQIQNLTKQRLDSDTEIAEKQRQFNNLKERDGALAALAGDPAYQRTLDKVRELESKLAVEGTRFQAENDEIRVLQQQRDSLLPVLRQEAQRVLGNELAKLGTELSVLATRQQVLTRAEAYWDREVQRVPVLSRVFTDLDRERTVATDSLNRLLETREKLQIEAAQKEIPWQLITPPERPDSPKESRERNLILGAIAGLLLGVGAALMSERLDRRLRTVTDLKKLSKLPVLGVIPHETNPLGRGAMPQILQTMQSDRPRYDLSQYSQFTESFRSLYTNLCLLNTDHPVRSLVVSSPTAGDGKTTVALYLAQAAAAMGQRVLLVDTDLRSPQIAERLEVPNEQGLTELIARNLNPQDVVQRINASATAGNVESAASEPTNFSVLVGGKIPLDPTRLLSSQKMQRLNDYFKAMYDLVIFDAPPLLNFADSSLLANHTDGMLVVTGLGKTDREDLRQMLDTLQTARISVLGIVANRSSSGSDA